MIILEATLHIREKKHISFIVDKCPQTGRHRTTTYSKPNIIQYDKVIISTIQLLILIKRFFNHFNLISYTVLPSFSPCLKNQIYLLFNSFVFW